MTYFKMNFHMALHNSEKAACIPWGEGRLTRGGTSASFWFYLD